MKVAFLWVGQQILLALLLSLRTDNNFGANTAFEYMKEGFGHSNWGGGGGRDRVK